MQFKRTASFIFDFMNNALLFTTLCSTKAVQSYCKGFGCKLEQRVTASDALLSVVFLA